MKSKLLSLMTIIGIGGIAFLVPSKGTLTVQARNSAGLTPLQQRLVSGTVSLDLNTGGAQPATSVHVSYFPDHADDQCAQTLGSNVKVNQNCLNLSDIDLQGRGQAQNETSIAADPLHPNNIVAGFNDYRRGDGNCYGAYTLNSGSNWNDTTIPMSFVRGTAFGGFQRQYFQAGGDTSVAWDTKGNAYFDCQMFQRGQPVTPNPDLSSAIYVFRSTGNKGASWNFPARPVVENNDVNGTSRVILEDKPLLTVDNHIGSPFQDRVYVSWTVFATDGTAKIFEAYSSDFGETFSAPVQVTQASPLCPLSVVGKNNCDANQFSQPFTGSDGNLYVVYANFDNRPPAGDNNQNQMLLSRSTNGGASFGAPVLVSPYNDLPDCATYQNGQDPGRACVPEKGPTKNSVFRAVNYPSGAVSPTNSKHVVVTFGSYISKDSNPSNGCVPTGVSAFGNNTYTGVKTAGACNNKILESVSNDGGATFTGTTATNPIALPIVSSASGQQKTDQFWQWAAYGSSDRLAVSYYDRQYGNDETTGSSDVSLTGIGGSAAPGTVRVTSSSMPVPTQFPDTQGNSVFYGDYTGLTVAGHAAYPIWMDTRSKDLALCPGAPAVCGFLEPSGIRANDQDIFTQGTPLP